VRVPIEGFCKVRLPTEGFCKVRVPIEGFCKVRIPTTVKDFNKGIVRSTKDSHIESRVYSRFSLKCSHRLDSL
jgi:hypothetical protein